MRLAATLLALALLAPVAQADMLRSPSFSEQLRQGRSAAPAQPLSA